MNAVPLPTPPSTPADPTSGPFQQKLPPAGMICRFVVLQHAGVAMPHFDLLLQVPGEEKLITWRLLVPPQAWRHCEEIGAERIEDHRAVYMTYEGEISGGRGQVRRVAEGEAKVVDRGGACGLRLRGTIECEIELPG